MGMKGLFSRIKLKVLMKELQANNIFDIVFAEQWSHDLSDNGLAINCVKVEGTSLRG